MPRLREHEYLEFIEQICEEDDSRYDEFEEEVGMFGIVYNRFGDEICEDED